MVTKKPNLFIVGAPKCGTSFLHENLELHPEVFMCPGKAPNYFDTDLHYVSPTLSPEAYLALYKKVKNEKIIGEASTWYLYSSSAAKNIHQFNPDAKIIIMLRDPVDMMYSLFYEHLFQGNEVEENFEKAIALEADRKRGNNIHKNSNPVESVYYKDIVSFSEQVARYINTFGRENVLVIIFDDLKKNPEEVFKNTLQFLAIDPEFKIQPKVINPSKVPYSKSFRELITRPPGFFRNLVRLIVPIHGLRIYIQEQLKLLNARTVTKKPIDPLVAERLRREMKDDVEKLSKLLNRDLTSWIKS